MNTVLIIGAGGVGHVVANKCAQLPDIFQNIQLAARTTVSYTHLLADHVRHADALLHQGRPQVAMDQHVPPVAPVLDQGCLLYTSRCV